MNVDIRPQGPRKRLAHLILRFWMPSCEQLELIELDIDRWCGLLSIKAPVTDWRSKKSVILKLLDWPEFRSVLYYRLRSGGGGGLLTRLYPPVQDLHLSTESIGPGLFIQHGFSTIIVAKSIGRNFWVNQQVTIGYSHTGKFPTIGDDVRVGAGAIVIGEILVGNGVTIAAGAVVTKSIPDSCVVAGNPARIIRREGIRVNLDL